KQSGSGDKSTLDGRARQTQALHRPRSWSELESSWDFISWDHAPGYRVSKHCTSDSSTSCKHCTKGTFTEEANGLSQCIRCQICDPEVHLRIEKECIPTRNTVCSCRPGYHCTLNVDGDCEQCAKHTVAPPGFQVIRSGTSLNDTHFIPCPPRTFSATEMSFSCEPWTNCSKVGMKEVQPGTAISDAICVCLCHDQVRTAILTSVFTVLLLCLLAVCVGIILWRRRKNSRKGAPREQQAEANGIYDPVPENDNPMTAPMQETAPHHGEPAYSVA
uniref:TNFR-Cys domain-containing protein n=1 Tax=Salvator merianae TaxID=96440 RepID=A0A8D0DNT3_SALMN